jgi:hypothetical protein
MLSCISAKMTEFNISFDDGLGAISSDDDIMPVDISNLVVSRRELTEEMQKSGLNFTNLNDQKKILFKFLIAKMQISDSQVEIIRSDLLEKIRLFLVKATKKYVEANRKYDRFVCNNEVFLSKNFDLPKPQTTARPTKSSKVYL